MVNVYLTLSLLYSQQLRSFKQKGSVMTQPKSLKDLYHAELGLQSGGKILLMNTGSLIGPEEEAMTQAMFSRNPSVISELLDILISKGPGPFMQQTYVGYGHKSVADNGSITVLFERVSMLAAKALQDFALYNGQECSTRYIDFTNQPFIDPMQSSETTQAQEAWRAFYLKALAVLKKDMLRRFPYKKFARKGESREVYEKTINARAFDVARGFLPAGCSTNVAWHGELRIFDDRLVQLRHHPLAEVRNIGETLEALLIACHERTFSKNKSLGVAGKHPQPKRYWETEAYMAEVVRTYYYNHDPSVQSLVCAGNEIDSTEVQKYADVFTKRPPHAELPKSLGVLGSLRFKFPIDYGGYRDLQRQRSVTQRHPLLTEDLGFHPWYLKELPATFSSVAQKELTKARSVLDEMKISQANRQYFIPMGYQVSCDFRGDLPAWVYIAELRAGTTVHATVRMVAHGVVEYMERTFGDTIRLHANTGPDRFDLKRGTQDIVVQ